MKYYWRVVLDGYTITSGKSLREARVRAKKHGLNLRFWYGSKVKVERREVYWYSTGYSQATATQPAGRERKTNLYLKSYSERLKSGEIPYPD